VKLRASSMAVLAVLACVLAADLCLLLSRERLRRDASRLPEERIWFPRADAVPSGLLASGLRYGPSLTKARCFALLYTSANCGFCSAERPDWSRIVQRSAGLGCDALRVVPDRNAEAVPGSGGALGRELIYVDPGWITGGAPAQTPTLMIFRRNAASAWCRVGRLDKVSARAALAALEAAAAGVPTIAGAEEKGGGGARLQCHY